jgi:hypothetical protein
MTPHHAITQCHRLSKLKEKKFNSQGSGSWKVHHEETTSGEAFFLYYNIVEEQAIV